MSGDRLTPSRVLVLRYALESVLTNSRSVTGVQLDQLRSGAQADKGGLRTDGLATLRLHYADQVRRCRDLTPEQERICRLRYGAAPDPLPGIVAWCRSRGAQPSEVETYQRLVPEGDVQRREWGPGALSLGTEAGEEQVEPRGEVALVRGHRARWPSYEEIAPQVGLSVWQVQRRISSALDAVRKALRQEPDDG